MLRHTLTLASITLVVSACGGAAVRAPKSPTAAAAKPATATIKIAPRSAVASGKAVAKPGIAPSTPAPAKSADAVAKSDAAPSTTPARKLGDFHVYQYSGAFSKQPVTLTEQVVAQEGDVMVVDFVLEEGQAMTALRVRMKPDNEVVAVARITDDGEVAATTADYDALMQKTEFVPDSNDAVLGTDHTSCLVGEEQVDCDVTTYRVTFGRKHAKLTITKSAKVPGRDIGGDVVGDDGKVLYTARLVERGNEPPVVEALAKLDRFTPEGP